MNANYESYQQQPPAPQKQKIPKAAWIIGCGCLALLGTAILALLVTGGIYYFFSGRDPIASAVPNSALMYVNIDFLQSQSDQMNKIVSIGQGITNSDQKPLADVLEEEMQNQLKMSFKNDVMNWMGQRGAFVVTGGDIQSGNIEFMFIMEARDKKLADTFITKFVAALENNGMNFEQKEVGGNTLYISKSDYGQYNDTVIARSGSLIYLANSEDPVTSSVNLKSADSLASSADYKKVMGALPSKRLAAMYISGDVTSTYMSEVSREVGASPLGQINSDIISGIGLSMAVVNEGLRFDAAVAYDETKLSDYQKNSLKAKYLAPKSDQMIPADTFFFFGINSSQSPASFVQADNPMYTQDAKEAFDMFKSEYNVSLEELFKLMTGELAIAIGPANDGVFPEQGNINLGATIFAATNDEAGFNAWMKNALDALSKNAMTPINITDVKVGDYNLQQAVVEGTDGGNLAIYGADNNFFVLGTSKNNLEKGLSGSGTLANDAVYRNTWKAFPSQSVPYLYFNVGGFLDMYKGIPYSDLGGIETDLRKIPVIALSKNQNSGYTSGATLIIFINTK